MEESLEVISLNPSCNENLVPSQVSNFITQLFVYFFSQLLIIACCRSQLWGKLKLTEHPTSQMPQV